MEGALEGVLLGTVGRGVVENGFVLAVTRVMIVYLAVHLQFQTDDPDHTLKSDGERNRVKYASCGLTASEPQSESGL